MRLRRTYFVSDLHLFSRRSQAMSHEVAIHSAAAHARLFVLGGDIFDFRWSTHGTGDASVQAAIRWIDNLVAAHPRCDFHFIQGNHDCNRRFVAALESYAAQRSNLAIHPYYLRLGRSIFLHGDASDRPRMNALGLQKRREHWARDEHRSPMRHMLYDLAVKAQLHRVVGRVAHPKRRVAQRILGYLQGIGHGPATGLEHVYFGHTHEALTNFRHQGLVFHNPGSPMPGLDFRIVEVNS